ncbi:MULTISPECIES: PepSY domain-containing protein [unclassified Rhodanobacter]|uniref:PepSY domain-containing protein n=1 Tax=Rhodanobacter humi TaxID=1888173 RepID=A0ABV4AK96_9GAMM|nr:PepSY domain-containing protein [Xanthomonadaceae bacterium]TAL98103.1 MAG: peptidase M4 [Rhodanobacter sp.]TAM41758.1 MAG: peptidase M4 [Rhodanobacter sp.]
MRKSIILVLPVALCGFVTVAQAQTPSQPATQAKISMMQARRIALKTFPGRIVSGELEQEAGGSGLRYSFDIKAGKNTHEVGVDAKTGKVLENSLDNNDAD